MISSLLSRSPIDIANSCYAACRYTPEDYRSRDYHNYAVLPPAWIERARNNRASEYLAGRYCAQQALLALTQRNMQVGANSDRSPIWPAGIVGSITHGNNFAAAIVAYKKHYRALGLDCEEKIKRRVGNRFESLILSDAELTRIECSNMDRQQLITIIFSAKESIYKALYPITNKFMEFRDCQFLEIDRHNANFEVTSGDLLNQRSGRRIAVRYAIQDRMIMTSISGAAD